MNQRDIGSKNVDHSDQLPTVLSLCTGYGGIERGLELAGFEHRTVAHVEIEAFAAANLVAKMEEGKLVPAPVWSDLKTLPAHCFRDRVDLLLAGYPCQPFSAAGLRQGTEDPRHLWPHIRQHIETIRPVRCFFENVEGHISLGLRDVIEDLEGLGYATTWGVFSAAEVGAPHQRKRVYILGDSLRQRPSPEWDERRVKGGSWQPGKDVADAGGKRAKQLPSLDKDTKRKTSARTEFGGSSAAMADAVSEGLQGRLPGRLPGRQDQEREDQQRHSRRGGAALGQQEAISWATEPDVGRVVNGAAFRVDRLRLLGNGVVPQTAAKAWITLHQQLADQGPKL